MLLFMLAGCSIESYVDTTMIHEQGLKNLVYLYDLGPSHWEEYKTSYFHYRKITREQEYPLIFASVPDPFSANYTKELMEEEWSPKVQDLRADAYSSTLETSKNGIEFVVAYTTQSYTKIESTINVIRTSFICVVLSMASIYFTRDAQNLVLDPLERMIEKVKLIAKNPLAAATDEVNEAGVMTFLQKKEEGVIDEKQRKEAQQYETAVLERAIVKIGHLLALGFGEAGGGIIGQNMTNGGELNPMMPGQKTYCIFGFCILDHFVDSTEVLQTEIMSFVNQVAEITHSMVDRYGGSANKNIGDAFLLVWKFYDPKEIEAMDVTGKFNNEKICLENQVIADVSVFSFLKIIAKLNKYKHILKYKKNKELQRRCDGKFAVRMGFGIHQGWAIEGAIGSFFKIDASYLSPNVNMAARLEAATKQFGTLLLISGHLRDILSQDFQDICREIDTVTVKGSIKPMRLFTIDIQTEDLESCEDPLQHKSIREKKAIRDQMKRDLFKRLYSGSITTWQEFNNDHEFLELRKNVDPEYEELFAKTYRAYIDGDWKTAGEGAAKLVEQRPEDGPAVNLNKIINTRHNRKTPETWKGYRELTSK